MNSPSQVEIPIWTIQVCCLSLSLALLILTVGIVCKRRIPVSIFLGIALLCTIANGWMLRVPAAFGEMAIRVVEKLVTK